MPPSTPPENELHTSVIIRALNEADHLPRLLEALQDQTRRPDEVILVDSGSTDNSVGIAESYGASIVHIPPGDFTFGGSLNLGCSHAKGDILIMVSAHVYPTDDSWIERLVAPFVDPSVGLCYGGQEGDGDSHYSEVQLMRDWFPDVDDPDQNHPFCNNANCAVRRDIWERHPYDETLPGLEDIAFGRNVLADGHKISYVADARIVHIHDEHFRQTLNRYRREAIAYAEIFGKGELDLLHAVKLFGTNLAKDLRTAKSEQMLARAGLPAAKFRFAQFAGAYLGHRSHVGDGAEVVRRMYYPRQR